MNYFCFIIEQLIFKKNLFQCPKCNKSQRIVNARDRFDVFFGDKNYEIIDIPIDKSLDDPLNWKDTKSYIERLKQNHIDEVRLLK